MRNNDRTSEVKTKSRRTIRDDFGRFSGVCKQLPAVRLTAGDLTDEEFRQLRDYLMETAYASNEVYNVSASTISVGLVSTLPLQTSTPMEFEKFQMLLKKNRFTMIIDGLNILYGIDRFATEPVRSTIKVCSRTFDSILSKIDLVDDQLLEKPSCHTEPNAVHRS